MTPLAHLDTDLDLTPQRPCAPDAWVELLDSLRKTALACRAAQRDDLFKACALLSYDRKVARGAYATALIKGLRSATANEPMLFRPGVADRSFDETWIIAALAATDAQDWDSLKFLLGSRICAMHRRNIAFLLRGIVDKTA